MIRATEAHRPALERALRRDAARAMFPLGNLAAHGMSGTGHRNATTYWVDDTADPSAVLGLTQSGGAMVYGPDTFDPGAMAAILKGRALTGINGAAGPVRAVMAAAGLTGAPAILDADEPQFLLDLAELDVPAGPGHLVPVSDQLETAIGWRMAYEDELHPPARPISAEDPPEWATNGTYRMLVDRGTPLAMTGLNARLPDIVQIGGVYTPPASRGRGLARRVVALHLAEARAQGVRQATLFAASDAAVACYTPLGFQRIGDFALVLFDGEVTP